jgi:hypothetical protein
MFNPAIIGEMLSKFLLGAANNIASIVEHQRAAAGSTLIYCEYISAHSVFSCTPCS